MGKEDKEFLKAIEGFRQAFVIAVGDKSPFAKIALSRLDKATKEWLIVKTSGNE